MVRPDRRIQAQAPICSQSSELQPSSSALDSNNGCKHGFVCLFLLGPVGNGKIPGRANLDFPGTGIVTVNYTCIRMEIRPLHINPDEILAQRGETGLDPRPDQLHQPTHKSEEGPIAGLQIDTKLPHHFFLPLLPSPRGRCSFSLLTTAIKGAGTAGFSNPLSSTPFPLASPLLSLAVGLGLTADPPGTTDCGDPVLSLSAQPQATLLEGQKKFSVPQQPPLPHLQAPFQQVLVNTAKMVK